MNNVCLCVGNYAKTPYYVKISDISLYSIEELCYYFMDKVYLLDDSIVSAELVRWIKLECGLTELAEELEIFVRKRMSAASFVTTILERTNMYDESTIKRIEQILKEQANLSSADRYRKQAEYLYKQGRYRQALIIYSELLDYLPKRDNLARAQLYYNIATIYAMDFAYNKAADFYYESYRLYPDRQARLAYILACRRSMSDYIYGSFKRENPDWEEDFREIEEQCARVEERWHTSKEKAMLSELFTYRDQGQTEEYYQMAGALLRQLKRDYKHQTQV